LLQEKTKLLNNENAARIFVKRTADMLDVFRFYLQHKTQPK